MSVTDLWPTMAATVGAGPTGGALLLATILATAVAAQGPGAAPTLAAATSRAVGLLPLLPVPSRLPLKKVREALARGGAELEAAFPELATLEEVSGDWVELVGTATSAMPTGQADLVAKLGGLPKGPRAELARGLAALAVGAALGDGVPLPEALPRVGDVLRALLAEAGDADASGAALLAGVAAAVECAVASGDGDDGSALGAFQGLQGVVPAAAFQAFVASGGDGCYGGQAAAKEWAAAL